MAISRRQAAKLALAGPGLIAAGIARADWLSQSPKRVRLPLSEFVQDERLLNGLRRAIAAMKARKPSDPLSWFFQAAIHGVTDKMIAEAQARDPAVASVDRAKYWNQCPHHGQNSANFLPWHRAYIHHLEDILRLHSGLDGFAIPYWDYSAPDNLDFPKDFGIQHLDGNFSNDDPTNINPLFHPMRDYFLCGYEHPHTDQLPLAQLSPRAVSAERALSDPHFFGEDEAKGLGGGVYDSDPGTRGLLEQSPHDQIHRVVGGDVVGTDDSGRQIEINGAMGDPGTAAFDPIFPVHHANIDRLWAKWSCMPGKSWGALPDARWFREAPWFFFGTDGKEINRPRMDYFDHAALGVDFKDPQTHGPALLLPDSLRSGTPLALAAMSGAMSMPAMPAPAAPAGRDMAGPVVASPDAVTQIGLTEKRSGAPFPAGNGEPSLSAAAPAAGAAPRAAAKTFITIHAIDLSGVHGSGFDIYLVRAGSDARTLNPASPGYLGPVNLFVHGMGGRTTADQTFDATGALHALALASLEGLQVAVVPYSLSTRPAAGRTRVKFLTGPLKASRISISAVPA